MYPRLILLPVTICLIFQVVYLQPLFDNITTSGDFAKIHSLLFIPARQRTVPTKNQNGIKTSSNKTTSSFPDASSIITDNTKQFLNRTKNLTHNRMRYTNSSARERQFSKNISTRNINNSLQRHFTDITKMAAPFIDNINVSIINIFKNNVDTTSATAHSTKSPPSAVISNHIKQREKSLNSPQLDVDTKQQNEEIRRKLVPYSSSFISPDEIHHTETEKHKLWNDDQFRKCYCADNKCVFENCKLTSVPDGLPTTITDLKLNNNEITRLNRKAFLRYSQLENLDLSYNKIEEMFDGAFHGLSNLISLNLSTNRILQQENLPLTIFEPLKSLKLLRINFVKSDCPSVAFPMDTVFAYLPKVEELYFDNYLDPDSGQGFGLGFRNMTSLRHVSVCCNVCGMQSIWNTTFSNLGHIKSLDTRNCDIDSGYIDSGTFQHFTNLDTIDISHNSRIGMDHLPEIMWGLANSNLRTLKMNHIVQDLTFVSINISLTECLPRTLTSLIARRNNILYIDRKAVKKLPKGLNTIDISENFIMTDPEDIPLEEIVGLETLLISSDRGGCVSNEQVPSVDSHSDQLRCQQNGSCKGKKISENEMTTHRLNSHIPLSLKRVKVNVGNMHDDYLLHIDDSNNLQELDVSCSFLPEINFGSFERLPHLRKFNARSSSVRLWYYPILFEMPSMETLLLSGNLLNNFLHTLPMPFLTFPNLTNLEISFNQLDNLPVDVFTSLDKLEYLRLDGNPFTRFEVNISNMAHLRLLNLSNTGLSYLTVDVRSHVDRLSKITPVLILVDMTGCPIQCDCLNLDFLKWMASSPAIDKNQIGYICKYPDRSLKYIEDGYEETIAVLDRECAKNYPMFLIVLAATSVLLCAVIGAVVYRFRWKLRYLYYAAYLKVMDKYKKDNQHEFLYDVFISYDSEDVGFVIRHLSPELEKRELKLLIHTRDFVAGTYIASNIVMAVAESRKTLVVLTRNLVESDWCNYELQMATMEAVHTGRQVLVFLLKENIPSRELDVDLLRHIRNNTYLPYPGPEEEGDESIMKKFYDKLAHDLKS